MAQLIKSEFEIGQLIADRKRIIAEMQEEARRLSGALKRLGAKEVYLFGSTAREDLTLEVYPDGTIVNDSDLDIAAILETELPEFERAPFLLSRLYASNYKFEYPMDLIVYTPREFSEGGTFIEEIARRGIPL